jgi:hypothetical protein
MIPVILGGLVGVGVGYMVKKICDENECGIDEKIEEGLMAIEEWFDEKTVALDNYLVSTKEKNKYQVEEEINLDSLQHMKKKVYHDSFVDFVTLYEKIENVDFGKLEYQEIDFDSKKYGDEIFDEIVQNNIKITTDLLFKSNNLLGDMVIYLNELIKNETDYENFEIKAKELLKEAFSLARFIQKVCINDSITQDVILKFNNIISSIQEGK